MNDLLRTRFATQDGVMTTSEAYACGYSGVSLSRLVASGELFRARAGCFVDGRRHRGGGRGTDAALFAGQVTRDELEGALRIARLGPGRADAAAAVELADGLAESPGESWARVLFVSLGLPKVESQAEIRDVRGRLVGRVDFLFRRERTVVEFDGLVKYGGADGRRALIAEKRREDALRSLRYQVVRSSGATSTTRPRSPASSRTRSPAPARARHPAQIHPCQVPAPRPPGPRPAR